VFVGRHRATDPNQSLSVGDEVFVARDHQPPEATALAGRDGDLFVFLKPPGLPTVPDRRGNASLLRAAARELGLTPAGLHVVTRLDTNVSGVVVLARGKDATRRAAALQAKGRLARRYYGLSVRAPSPAAGIWDAAVPVRRGPTTRGRAARAARTAYRVAAEAPLPSPGHPALIVFEPITGRTHQIRIHAAGAGAPLLGDVAYGGPARVVLGTGVVLDVPRVALHACRVDILGETGSGLCVEAPHPDDLVAFWARLGGNTSAFDGARSLSALSTRDGAGA
jgi:23S rRNA-/tRNA-specific pseudouridylate synthase